MNDEQEFIFNQVVATSKLESSALDDDMIELLHEVITEKISTKVTINKLKQHLL